MKRTGLFPIVSRLLSWSTWSDKGIILSMDFHCSFGCTTTSLLPTELKKRRPASSKWLTHSCPVPSANNGWFYQMSSSSPIRKLPSPIPLHEFISWQNRRLKVQKIGFTNEQAHQQISFSSRRTRKIEYEWHNNNFIDITGLGQPSISLTRAYE